jgi:hypothetical protein
MNWAKLFRRESKMSWPDRWREESPELYSEWAEGFAGGSITMDWEMFYMVRDMRVEEVKGDMTPLARAAARYRPTLGLTHYHGIVDGKGGERIGCPACAYDAALHALRASSDEGER